MDNKIYVTGSLAGWSPGSGITGDETGDSGHTESSLGEIFVPEVTTQHSLGLISKASFSFKLPNSDSTAGLNILSPNAKHLFAKVGGAWVKLNSLAFNTTIVSGETQRKADYLIKDLNNKCLNNDSFFVTFNYNPVNQIINGTLTGKAIGTASNPIVATEGSTNYGETGIAFSSDTASANINDANITEFHYNLHQTGKVTTLGVFKIKVNRNGFNRSRTVYKIKINIATEKTTNGNFIYKTFTGSYITGRSRMYKKGSGDTYLSDVSGTDEELNDNLINNLRIFLINNKFTSNGTVGENNFNLTDWFDFSAIIGSSGAKYFNMTRTDSLPGEDDVYITADVDMGVGGQLYSWDIDSNDIMYATGAANYTTPDFDFGEPNIRKKIYKAYVTYIDIGALNNGQMSVYYKINQGATWVLCDTPGTTYNGNLDSMKTNFYRQEITFGTGGNNVFSFALKFENTRGSITHFEMNDLTFVYRIKTAK